MRRIWREGERQVVVDLYPHNDTSYVAKKINRTAGQVYNMAHKLGLKKTRAYLSSLAEKSKLADVGKRHQFKKGQAPWNKGKEFNPGGRSKETQFKKGSKPANQKPIGHERVCAKDNYILIKVDEINPYTGFRGYYKHKHVVIWEEHHGEKPKGKVIIFKDGDKRNFNISNLDCISRGENMKRNSHHTRYPKEVSQLIQLRGALNRQINKRANP